MKNFLDDSIVIHNSKPPLRWIANLAGDIACKNILEVSYMQEEGNTGLRYKYYCFLWDKFWPIYKKYGTFYKINTDMSSKAWDDYDDDGHPYWDYDWHEDDEYESNWRLIKNETKAGTTHAKNKQ